MESNANQTRHRGAVWRILGSVGLLALSAFVLPYALAQASRWNGRPKAGARHKTQLVSDLTRSYTNAVVQADFLANHLSPPAANEPAPGSVSYTATLSTWLTESSQLGSKLLVYFETGDPCPGAA